MTGNLKSEHDALLEAMLLAAGADGKVTKPELEAIFARIYSHPTFSSFQKEHVRERLEAASQRLEGSPGLQAVCESIAERLETVVLRELAFRCAAAVALVDNRADYRELKALKALQDALGLTEAKIVNLFELAEADVQEIPEQPAP